MALRWLALIAHDGKKDEMVRFATEHREFLERFPLVATASTGRLLQERLGLRVECLRHGPEGGDVQIACRVIDGEVAAVFFFVEELDVHPHDPDIKTLVRACNISNVPLATNPATAHLILRGDLQPE
ncbi:MAG: methylglyoxal synthase [Fimbriimonadaceae bacterium]